MGDTLSDLRAAVETGVTFVARVTASDPHRFHDAPVAARVDDMAQLAALVGDGSFELAGPRADAR